MERLARRGLRNKADTLVLENCEDPGGSVVSKVSRRHGFHYGNCSSEPDISIEIVDLPIENGDFMIYPLKMVIL